jgi:hypothetical protein
MGSDDAAYELFKRTLAKAIRDHRTCELDATTSVPPASSHIVIDSAAVCACMCTEPPADSPSPIDRDESAWFHDLFLAQGFAEFPRLAGVTRYYTGKPTPRVRMVLQQRDVSVHSPTLGAEHVAVNDSFASLESIFRLLAASPAPLPEHAVPAPVPAIPDDCTTTAWSSYGSGDTLMPACEASFTDDGGGGGVRCCVAGLLLSEWEARMLFCVPASASMHALMDCFTPAPTIIVKQNAWTLFHRGLPDPVPLRVSQVRYMLCRFSRVVLFDAHTNTASRLDDDVAFRLADSAANAFLSLWHSARCNAECAADTRPTKRLRRLLSQSLVSADEPRP